MSVLAALAVFVGLEAPAHGSISILMQLALTINNSYLYLPDLVLRHCPPVSGCTATLLIGDLPK